MEENDTSLEREEQNDDRSFRQGHAIIQAGCPQMEENDTSLDREEQNDERNFRQGHVSSQACCPQMEENDADNYPRESNIMKVVLRQGHGTSQVSTLLRKVTRH